MGGNGAGGTGGANGSCQVLPEVWVIDEHCVAGFVGEDIPFDQDGCNIEVRGAFSGLSGTLTEAGEITIDGALGVMELSCTGTYSETEIALTCTDDCQVSLSPGT